MMSRDPISWQIKAVVKFVPLLTNIGSNKKLSYCLETARRGSLPKIDV